MSVFLVSVLLVLLLQCVTGHPHPVFPKSYSASVIFQVPYVLLDLPIQVDLDHKLQKQVVHFFNDLTTEYISVTDRQMLRNVYNQTTRICLDESPSRHAEGVDLVNIFPNMTDFVFENLTVVRGLQVERWVRNVTRPGEVEQFYYDPLLKLPVRWTMHSRDEVFDSHKDVYIIDYVSIRELERTPQRCDVCSSEGIAVGQTVGPAVRTPSRSSHLQYLLHGGRQRESGASDSFSKGYVPLPERAKIQIYGNFITVEDLPDLSESAISRLPASFDWRDFAGSPAPRDQAMCGSCFAFAVIGAIESQLMIRKNVTAKLSEQYILDCGWGESSRSCSGGSQEEVGRIIMDRFEGKIVHDKPYGQYMSTYSYCKKVDDTGFPTESIDGWVNLPSKSSNEHIKQILITYGLLSVSINAVDEIVFYNGNQVIQSDECKDTKSHQLDHAVNLVGFGKTNDGTEYWILRNSWSTNWGDNGYFKIEMGDRDCGVTLDVSFPIIKSAAKKAKTANPEELDMSVVLSA